MIIPDINLLVYAHDSGARRHAAAKSWWESLMNGTDTVGLPWAVILGFIRITTNRRILDKPLDVAGSCRRVRSWLARPQVILIEPGVRHADIFFAMLESLGTAGNLTTDAHLAALTIEHQARLHSTDADMARFPGLKWLNPLR
ncbi:MAG: type II toxin-antitoxin system VapC family toxin [Gammaproteobacteria bacterium]|nr:type II toxin-antitoxin system VapC family toxin [Gammaproteobacteria bacterium]